jgi:hypothetical protein
VFLEEGIKIEDSAENVEHISFIRGSFEKFVDWRQCTAVIQREVVTVMPSCSGGGNAVVA